MMMFDVRQGLLSASINSILCDWETGGAHGQGLVVPCLVDLFGQPLCATPACQYILGFCFGCAQVGKNGQVFLAWSIIYGQ